MHPTTITYDKVYYVIDEDFPDRNPSIAILPVVSDLQHNIYWQNTGSQAPNRKFKQIFCDNQEGIVLDGSHPPKEIKIILLSDKVLVLKELTCDVFNNRMKYMGEGITFANDEEIQNYYKNYEKYMRQLLNAEYTKMQGS